MSKTAMTRATATTVDVRPARTARERKQFLDLPYRLHRHQEHWIAPLRMSQKDILDTARHPFYKTADVEKFLAYRHGRVVGRIMAIVNRAYNDFHNERAGFFGFFEVEEDYEAAAALLDRSKKESPIFLDRAADGPAVLGAGERRIRDRRKGIARLETLVAEKAKQIAVKIIGAGLSHHIHDTAGRPPEFPALQLGRPEFPGRRASGRLTGSDRERMARHGRLC